MTVNHDRVSVEVRVPSFSDEMTAWYVVNGLIRLGRDIVRFCVLLDPIIAGIWCDRVDVIVRA